MTTEQRIATLLKATGVYRMDGSTLIDAEMEGYAFILERILEDVQTLQDGIFFDNPNSRYCEYYEQLFGLPVSRVYIEGPDLESRKANIVAMKRRLAINGRSFDDKGLKEALKSFGLTVTFQPDGGELAITILEDLHYLETEEERDNLFEELLAVGVQLGERHGRH